MDLAEQTRKILSTLTPREEKVLRMRFGISERIDHVVEKKPNLLDLTKEPTRPVDAVTARKLRNPSRRKVMKPQMK